MPYLNGVSYCDPLGDLNVWGTMFQLPGIVPEIIMLATKVGRFIYVCLLAVKKVTHVSIVFTHSEYAVHNIIAHVHDIVCVHVYKYVYTCPCMSQ